MVYSKKMRMAAGDGLSRHYRRSLVKAPAPSMSSMGDLQMVKRAFVKKESEEKAEVKKVKVKRACHDCSTLTPPCWRYGPNGFRTLCNACGLRYRKKRSSSSQLNSKQKSKSSYSKEGGMRYEETKQAQKEKQEILLRDARFNPI